MIQLTDDRSIAWVRLLAQAKVSPVTVRYCGETEDGRWLWQVTNKLGIILAKQGDEFQVIEWMKGG